MRVNYDINQIHTLSGYKGSVQVKLHWLLGRNTVAPSLQAWRIPIASRALKLASIQNFAVVTARACMFSRVRRLEVQVQHSGLEQQVGADMLVMEALNAAARVVFHSTDWGWLLAELRSKYCA